MTDNAESTDLALTVYAPAEPAEPGDPDPARRDPDPADGGDTDPGSTANAIALAAERDRLARALRDTHRQLAAAESQLMSVKRSATMELGQVIVAAAKRPWIGGPRLPRHLYRMWRERRAGRAAGSPGDGFRSADEERWARILLDAGAGAAGDRFLAAYTVPGLAWSAAAGSAGQDMADGLVVAGVLTDASCAALAPDATPEQLLPHDAAFVLEGSGADLVLIEAAALLPGGPWAHAGDPAASDRGRRLADLIDLARALGKPVIFLRNAPSYLMPYLDWLSTACDAVVDGGLGVQLARFNPVDLPAARATAPVYAGRRDPREGPAVKRLLDELTGGELPGTDVTRGLLAARSVSGDTGRPGSGGGTGGRGPAAAPVRVIGEPSWRTAPEVYRQHAVFLAATAAEAREQLACGARVIGPVTEGTPVSAATPAATAEQAASLAAAAAAAGPRGMTEIRAILHELFEKHAVPVRLAELCPAGRAAAAAGARAPGRRPRRSPGRRQRRAPRRPGAGAAAAPAGGAGLAGGRPGHDRAGARGGGDRRAGPDRPRARLADRGRPHGQRGERCGPARRGARGGLPVGRRMGSPGRLPRVVPAGADVCAGMLPGRRGRLRRGTRLRFHRHAGPGYRPDGAVPRGCTAPVDLGPAWPAAVRGRSRGIPRPRAARCVNRSDEARCDAARSDQEGIVHVRTAGRTPAGAHAAR